jgi:hypothetical protein
MHEYLGNIFYGILAIIVILIIFVPLFTKDRDSKEK